jgi:GAF domain-containing protein
VVARHREPVRLADASADPRHYNLLVGRTGLSRAACLRPGREEDQLLGVIQVINKRDGTLFSDDELRLVRTLADHAAIAIENASLYRDARPAAISDDLTGLANTRHFNRMLPALMARGEPLTPSSSTSTTSRRSSTGRATWWAPARSDSSAA